MTELFERALSFLLSRRTAYRECFLLTARGQEVLADLAKFCRAHESTFNPDPHVAAKLDGRREVWNRIQHQLRLTDDELWALYGKKIPGT